MIGTPGINNKVAEENISVSGDNSPSRLVKTGAIICALTITVALLGGYMFLRARHANQIKAQEQAEKESKVAPSPQAQIYEDEAILKGANAILGGTVRNISGEKLEQLTVEMELISRAGGGTQTQTLDISPHTLLPDEEGRYSLTINSREWSAARLTRLISRSSNTEIAFKSAPGAKRPLERAPQDNPRTVVVERPKSKGEEFLNTPDKPIVIR